MKNRILLASLVALGTVLALLPTPVASADSGILTVTTESSELVINQDTPTRTAHPAINRSAGTYDLTWTLRVQGGITTVLSGTVTGVVIPANGALTPITIAGADLPDERYQLDGTVTAHTGVADPETATFWNVFVVDTVAPNVTLAKQDRSVIYPRVASGSRPGDVGVRFEGDLHDISRAEVRSSTGVRVSWASRTDSTVQSVGYRWGGRDLQGRPAPPGVYTIFATDRYFNRGAASVQVVVSSLHSVLWTRTVKPGPTMVDKYVGRCSKLARPAAGRGWLGSIGLYANTRCGTRTIKASLVSTLHGVHIPASVGGSFSFQVIPYGGTQAGRPGRAVIRYLDNRGRWSHEKVMAKALGDHPGDFIGGTGYRSPRGNLYWGVYTALGYRYDIRSFKVKVYYLAY